MQTVSRPICAVRDLKTGFDNPFAVRATAEAVREFNYLKTDTATKFGKHPEDYTLFHIANYNDVTGEITSLIPPEQLA